MTMTHTYTRTHPDRTKIWEDIQEERADQDEKWGGVETDDKRSFNDWIAFIVKQLGRAIYNSRLQGGPERNFRARMIRVAALAVAAIEAIDRARERRRAEAEASRGG